MSSREPMWYCHECHSEMRPLMTPEPCCASCHGSFVEKMENPSDDPREFQQHAPADFQADGYPPGIDHFLFGLHSLLDRPPERARSPSGGTPTGSNRTGPASRGTRIEMGTPGNGRTARRTWVLGGPNTLGARPGGGTGSPHPGEGDTPSAPMTMSEFLRSSGEARAGGGDTGITGPMMAQYLLALMGHTGAGPRGGVDPLSAMFGLGMGEGQAGGRWGDYVFGQEALDQIITQLMENSNSNRPVPATDEIVGNLPRQVLERNLALLERDCAVCKEQFKLDTEDPEEQVVITLPCKHPFHEPCILPWLKSSGTCPVCRHALVPQPEHHAAPSGSGPPGGNGGSRPGSPPGGSRFTRPGSPPRAPGGLFNAIFGHGNGSSSSSGGGNGSGSRGTRANSDPGSRNGGGRENGGGSGRANSRSGSGSARQIPGSWVDELD